MHDQDPRPRRGLIRRALRFVFRLTVITVGPLALALAGAYYYVKAGRYATTDNAYVKADKIFISAEVSGRAVEVAVGENLRVGEGTVLLRIDDEPYRIALQQAEAELRRIKGDMDALRAAYREKVAEQDTARESLAFYQREFDRREELLARGVTSEARFDEARHNVEMARKDLAVTQQQIARIVAELGGDAALPIQKHPRYMHAMAARDRASLDLERTVIMAPAAGVVTNIPLQPGEYITAEEPLFGLVVTDDMWIEANFKETDLTHIRVGQTAVIAVDTYPDHEWTAEVGSISSATGAEFAILPPQNASGNWVKVVQRIPVRLYVQDYTGDPPLRAGMSVEVKVDTGHQRELPEIVDTALAWLNVQQ